MSNSWVCVDANLVVRLVANPADTVVQALWDEWDAEQRPIAAPTLLYYEVTNALYRYHTLGLMREETARLATEAALALPVHLFGDPGLHLRAISLAAQLGLSATYDAHYLALAELLNGELWTADERLARAVQGILPWVRLVK